MDLFSPVVERVALSPTAWCDVRRGWLNPHAEWMARLVTELPLRQETLTVYGKQWPTPRLTSLHGDRGLRYTWSGRTFEPEAWTQSLIEIRDLLEMSTRQRYNSVLANYYRDGKDAMGAHADDEHELGPAAPDDVLIASVSLGDARKFVLKPNSIHGSALRGLTLELGHGDLLVMGGSTQREYKHHVPRTSRAVGPRMNLTFRIMRQR